MVSFRGLRFDDRSPVYQQVAEYLKRQILLGLVEDGEPMPSRRELAAQTGINPNTVERAFAALEKQGLIRTIPKKGAFVHRIADADEHAREEARRQLRAMRRAGLSADDVHALVEEIFGEETEDGTPGGASGPEGGNK